jgi:hypothetical protein
MDNLCGEHHYGNITKVKIEQILIKLKEAGATITGNNPWDVDIHNHGVKLRGTWVEARLSLSIIVTAKNWYVPCSKIWENIDPLINHISSLTDAQVG